MTSGSGPFSMIDLFRSELSALIKSLREGLKKAQTKAPDQKEVETLIRAAHSIKGAARIVQVHGIASLAFQLEELFIAIRDGRVVLAPADFKLLFGALDQMAAILPVEETAISHWVVSKDRELQDTAGSIAEISKKLSAHAPSERPGPFEQQPFHEEPTESPPKKLNIDLSMIDLSMIDLFRIEVETQVHVLNEGMINIEQGGAPDDHLEVMMRAAHSIKGAARVVGIEPIVGLAHRLEDLFVAAQEGKLIIVSEMVDLLLQVTDFLAHVAKLPPERLESWLGDQDPLIVSLSDALKIILEGGSSLRVDLPDHPMPSADQPGSSLSVASKPTPLVSENIAKKKPERPAISDKTSKRVPDVVDKDRAFDRVLRVTAQNLNRLMGLAGESLVESRWLQPFADSLLQMKISQNDLASTIDILRESLKTCRLSEKSLHYLREVQHKTNDIRQGLSDRIGELEMFIRRHASLSDRLYHEVIESRMRPFADGVEGFPRFVRDVARQLGKKVRLEIIGKNTPVDRDILEKLEAPLNHMLRNALDHGLETPEERIAAGKKEEGVIRLEARHRAGILAITITDDGRGIDVEKIRNKIIQQNLVSEEMASKMTESELVDFLFLPGFSTTSSVTEISGRGVGLDVVQSMIQDVGGVIRTFTEKGHGTSFNLQLPLTLSVIRALIVRISGEPYAFPLARIDRALVVDLKDIQIVENRQFFRFEGENIGLVTGYQVLELDEYPRTSDEIPVIVMSDRLNAYGIAVDKILGERELVVHELDRRLGKVQDIASGAFMENGEPVLVIDIEDTVRSIDTILHGGRLKKVGVTSEHTIKRIKRILVVDDSITVREVECRLLRNQGYEVDAAVDGMDGWNAVRLGNYDLIVTDVDMPRMNGIELVRLIKEDERLHSLPVLIVSYKEREEDRIRGLEAGANYYLTKSSFHDETLLDAVEDLIGKPRSL